MSKESPHQEITTEIKEENNIQMKEHSNGDTIKGLIKSINAINDIKIKKAIQSSFQIFNSMKKTNIQCHIGPKEYSQSDKAFLLNNLSNIIKNEIKMKKIEEMISKNGEENRDFYVIERIICLNLLVKYPFDYKRKKKNNSKAVNYQHCIACLILYDIEDEKYDCKNRTNNYLYNHLDLCNEKEKFIFCSIKIISMCIKKINSIWKKLNKAMPLFQNVSNSNDMPYKYILEKYNQLKVIFNNEFHIENNTMQLYDFNEFLKNAFGY